MKFLWTTIYVNDMEASLKFYQEVVGLPIKRRFTDPTGMELAFLGFGETEVELICEKDGKQVEIEKNISMGFEIISVDEKIKELEASGLAIYSGPMQPNPMIRFFYVLDPNGLKIQFVERVQS
ncbi:MAG: glyoxalase [Firmicutes bacterium HGW-Firmicutes-7]|nr:MAG: glyoxalase [Firmicutes bacterium HGW-Firmicutes-7]